MFIVRHVQHQKFIAHLNLLGISLVFLNQAVKKCTIKSAIKSMSDRISNKWTAAIMLNSLDRETFNRVSGFGIV